MLRNFPVIIDPVGGKRILTHCFEVWKSGEERMQNYVKDQSEHRKDSIRKGLSSIGCANIHMLERRWLLVARTTSARDAVKNQGSLPT